MSDWTNIRSIDRGSFAAAPEVVADGAPEVVMVGGLAKLHFRSTRWDARDGVAVRVPALVLTLTPDALISLMGEAARLIQGLRPPAPVESEASPAS